MNFPLDLLLLALALATGAFAGHVPAAHAAEPPAVTASALPGDSLYHVQAALVDQHGAALPWPGCAAGRSWCRCSTPTAT